MSAEFRPTFHQESADEILPSHDEGQEILEENKPSEYESIDESTAGSYASTDHSNPVSVEYNYIDDVNPASDYGAIEGSQSESNDYEYIAGTNPAYDYIEVITEPRTLTSKCKKTILFLVPIFASVIVNITVGSLMLLPLPHFRGVSSGIRWTVLITFRVIFGLAAALCSPLMVRYGFRKVALGGSVLHICSSCLSSLTATDDILVILIVIMRGIAVGLLRTIGVVATVDHLYTRPALALVISHTSFTVGIIIGFVVHSHTMKAFEISAVLGLIAGSFLQKNSQTQQNASKLFKHPPFYFLLLITLAASVGLFISKRVMSGSDWSIVTSIVIHFLVLVGLVIIRNFQREKLNKSALLLMGISVLALSVVTMALRGALAVSFLLGAATALSQIMLPLALVNTTGRSNLKLALPVLGCFEVIGGLIGLISLLLLGRGALYIGGAVLIMAGVFAIIAWVLIKRWTPLGDESEEEDHVENHVEETEDHVEETEDHVEETEDQVEETQDHGGEAEDHVEQTEDQVEETQGHVGEAEDHVEQTEDQVEETEDHVEQTEDQVEETQDHVGEAEDHVEQTEDQVEETEDQVEQTEDHVEETQDHVEETEDHVEETEDQVEETQDHVGEAEDHVEETEDQVEETEDQVEETQDHVEETGDHVEQTQDNVEETEDQVEETEDQVEETEDQVEETQDQVEETQDQVEETEDQIEETEDHVGEAEDHVEETEDHVGETEDHVGEAEDHVGETEHHDEETEDQVEETEDHVGEAEDHVGEAEDTGQMEKEDPGN
ncbi:uncharacterized protein [Haliotis cracherodii]|uniref:uncharacterized protein n=1 Tax=Haliotis cracherodii TaxID=6455 RepID=UPI0039EB01F7